MGFNTDNFDKEFSLNQNRKKTSARGKLTSWLMILAGVAVIGGVVAARQPVLRQTDAGTRTTVSMPAGQMVAGEHLVYNAVNDEQGLLKTCWFWHRKSRLLPKQRVIQQNRQSLQTQ